MQIFVKTLSGRTLTVEAMESYYITDLKARIEEIEGVPIDQQRVIFAGKPMDNTKPLSDYGIRNASTLHLMHERQGEFDALSIVSI